VMEPPLRQVEKEVIRCNTCGEFRVPETTHAIKGNEPFAQAPLERLGIPKLDILKVCGPGSARWYELTGDLETLPFPLQTRTTEVDHAAGPGQISTR